MKQQELGIYIHIPFCKSKCYYCDFVSYPNQSDMMQSYFEAVKREINSYDFKKYNITTIYLGGGTPSFVQEKYIKMILEEIQVNLEKTEITIEINPGTVSKEKLQFYKDIGINRISIGLQSVKDNLLKQIGRIHTYKQFLETYKEAKEVGFRNINVDLMIGLPNQTIQDIKETVEEIERLNPSHVSVYSLIVEEGTVLAKQLEKGIMSLPEEEIERQMYWYVKNKLELLGYEQYEISNYAKKGQKSLHNWNCWGQKEYIGIGVAAHSYKDGVRYANTDDLATYIKSDFISNQRIVEEVQTLDEKKKEFMLLGLRKIEGVSISAFKEKFVDNPIFLYRKELEELVSDNLIVIEGDFIRLTSRGLDFANLVWEKFI